MFYFTRLDSKAIQSVIEKSEILKRESRLPYFVAFVMIYDLLFGRGIHCKGHYRDALMRSKTRLHSELVKIKVKQKVKSNKELARVKCGSPHFKQQKSTEMCE
jgi:putative methyltransferase